MISYDNDWSVVRAMYPEQIYFYSRKMIRLAIGAGKFKSKSFIKKLFRRCGVGIIA